MNQKPDKFLPSLYGGIIMALVSSIPFLSFINCFCCAGILFGGLMAVFFYKNNFTPGTPPFTSGDCMAVGALAGIISAVFTTILSGIFLAMYGDAIRDFVLGILHNSNVQIPDQSLKMIEDALRTKSSVFMMSMNFVKNIILHTLFGLLGGLIGYSIYKPRVPVIPLHQQQWPPPPPAPPPAPPSHGA